MGAVVLVETQPKEGLMKEGDLASVERSVGASPRFRRTNRQSAAPSPPNRAPPVAGLDLPHHPLPPRVDALEAAEHEAAAENDLGGGVSVFGVRGLGQGGFIPNPGRCLRVQQRPEMHPTRDGACADVESTHHL